MERVLADIPESSLLFLSRIAGSELEESGGKISLKTNRNCIACGMSEADAIAISEISDELLKKIKK